MLRDVPLVLVRVEFDLHTLFGNRKSAPNPPAHVQSGGRTPNWADADRIEVDRRGQRLALVNRPTTNRLDDIEPQTAPPPGPRLRLSRLSARGGRGRIPLRDAAESRAIATPRTKAHRFFS